MTDKNPLILWFRHDLRLDDNPALIAAAHTQQPVIALYIYDEASEKYGAASKLWLHHSLNILSAALKEKYSINLLLKSGDSLEQLKEVVEKSKADSIFWNRRYEPYIVDRDKDIKKHFTDEDLNCKSFNSALLFEPWEIQNNSNEPYKVFTPFYKKCLTVEDRIAELQQAPSELKAFDFKNKIKNLELKDFKLEPDLNWDQPILNSFEPGFKAATKLFDEFLDIDKEYSIINYDENRNTPSVNGTSKLSTYLHFGEISPRQICSKARKLIVKLRKSNSNNKSIENIQSYIREIYWREFAYQLLYNFPKVVNSPLNDKYSKFPFIKDKKNYHAWCHAMTGYPIVDAGMRELWYTGWMHNRVRMIVSSFLVKHQLISWQEGEKWFWDTLIDADMASNNMGWQWVAGCGADAAPYFRIFNPITQGEKFDPKGDYVRKWVPELRNLENKWIMKPFEAPKHVLEAAGIEFYNSLSDNEISKKKNLKVLDWDALANSNAQKNYYPQPVVEHKYGRERALEALEQVK